MNRTVPPWKVGRRKARTTLLCKNCERRNEIRDRSWSFNVSVLSPVIYHRELYRRFRIFELGCFFSSVENIDTHACDLYRKREREREREARSSKVRRRMERNFRIDFPSVLIKTSPYLKYSNHRVISPMEKEGEKNIRLLFSRIFEYLTWKRNNSSLTMQTA